ncbi:MULTISPECIES: hypothetical protein [Bacillus cereus group]|uniref:hypothetical protein n=1 Tax=Bacillus cereus group TaxID=86661 RepID=UPI000BFBE1DF|nr:MULTISPECIES: hypothetical protein [Bacillus cereus group]MCU4794624.1 hypothetical protein [Bacillus cereus]MCU5437567.1 hypothetical protein [Bacillus cereus]PHG75165.1 hypothetical protein COI50_22265 [Bacillus wiedmannii]
MSQTDFIARQLTGEAITKINQLLGLTYYDVAYRLACSPSNVNYHLGVRGNGFSASQRYSIVEMWKDNGVENTEIILLLNLINRVHV